MDKESFQARKEIARRKVDQALWVKAMSQSKGDKNEAKKRYVEIRSEQLKEKNVKGSSAEMMKLPKQEEENTKEKQNKEKNMNTIFKRLDLWITAVIFILMLGAERYELLPRIENPLIGLRHEFRAQTLPAEETEFLYDDILIVDTEEEFFEEYGSWPLKRKDIAKMVTNLKRLGAEVIALDMIMDFPNGYGEDPILAEALQESGKTMVVSLLNLDTPIWYSLGETRLNGITDATEILNESTERGYTNVTEIGGQLSRIRFYPEIIKEHNIWPYAVQALAMYLDVEPTLEDGVLTLGDLSMPLDEYNFLWIDFPKLPAGLTFLKQTPAVITALEVLMDLEDLEDLDEEEFLEETEDLREMVEGKLVLVGDTSEMSHDIFETPVGEVYGIEIIADTVATMMKQQPIRPAPFAFEALVMLILLLAFFAVSQLKKFENLVFLLVIVVYSAINIYFYIYHGLVFSLSYPLVACFLSMITINLYLFMLERKQKTFIRGAFSQYLSPAVIDMIVKDPDKLKLGGERREMTAFFSDIQGFSTVSESLTPEELVQLLNEYLTSMCEVISSYNGTVDKFEGDAIIAFWGAPLDNPDHARDGCMAALDMQERNIELRKKLREENRPMLYTRMGINSGPIVVGNMGSATKTDYTMMGDNVNLAARLEGANKFYKTYTMIAENTYKLAEDSIDVRYLDVVRVVGKNEPVKIYQLLAKKNQLAGSMQEVLEHYEKGMNCYKNLNFKDAIMNFENALKLEPEDGPCLTYVNRCKMYLEQPPPKDWDGVFNFTEKG